MLRVWISIILIALTHSGYFAPARMSDKNVASLAPTALDAWEPGERGRGWDAFRSVLSPDFRVFNHPFAGRASGSLWSAELSLCRF